jgi:hypothetical protein
MKILFSVLCLALVHPVAAQQKEFSWLVGRWKIQDKNEFEEWSPGDDHKSLHGISYRVNGTDTTTTEEIKIIFSDDAFFYVPDVAGSQEAVMFKIIKHDVKSFVAENPAHDFPKTIRYVFNRKENSEWLHATIEGDGKKISYTFVRVK